MITRIDLEKFKCFDILRLPLSRLTLLSGTNASGKSTVLQAIALLHQTMREDEWSKYLLLNGASVKLGTVSDVVDKVNGRFEFAVGLIDEDLLYRWRFSGERSQLSMIVAQVKVNDYDVQCPDLLRNLLPFDAPDTSLAERIRDLTYITAERVGPREVYPVYDPKVTPVVGPRGEFTVSVLYALRDIEVFSGLAIPNMPTTLLQQTQARMRAFFPGCRLDIQPVPQANAVTLGLLTSEETNYHRPIHSGFGLTQILPIIVSSLSARPGGLLLIENPEVHLHPAGQAAIGQFMAEVASAGVQVILETHSDHVLNGVRRAVKTHVLSPEDVAIHFFRPRDESAAQVLSPALDESGNIDDWPDGFFDQFDKDMNYFAGWEESLTWN